MLAQGKPSDASTSTPDDVEAPVTELSFSRIAAAGLTLIGAFLRTSFVLRRLEMDLGPKM